MIAFTIDLEYNLKGCKNQHLQWQESEIVGEALADLLHDPSHRDQPAWNDMHQSLRLLAQQLIDHRNARRAQIERSGGQTPQ